MFFRAGVLGLMEEIREEKISEILSWLQATARGKMARKAYQKLKAQKVKCLFKFQIKVSFDFSDIQFGTF